MNNYILKDKTPIPCEDIIEWGQWFGSHPNRHVGNDMIGDIHVSTVFLAIDHNWNGGRPILFETMIFGGEHDQYQERCSTWEEAEEMHARALKMVTG